MVPLRKEDLHPRIREQLRQVEATWQPMRYRDTLLAIIIGVTLFAALLSISVQSIKVPAHVLGFVAALILFVLIGGAVLYFMQRAARVPLLQALGQLTDTVSLSAGERAYVEVVQALAESKTLSESTRRDLLPQANALLEHWLQLEGYEHQLRGIAGTATETDLQRLRKQWREATDPVAREALQQSIEILRQRLHQRDTVEAHLQRVAALKELILQMFSSLHESLIRLQVLPASAETVDVHLLYLRLSEVQSETRAIEQALQELQVSVR